VSAASPAARLDDAVDGRTLVHARGEGDVRVSSASSGTMQVKVLVSFAMSLQMASSIPLSNKRLDITVVASASGSRA